MAEVKGLLDSDMIFAAVTSVSVAVNTKMHRIEIGEEHFLTIRVSLEKPFGAKARERQICPSLSLSHCNLLMSPFVQENFSGR